MATLRESLKQYLPSWLNDNSPIAPSYGYRFLSAMVRFLDTALANALSAALSSVGLGVPSSLKYLGWARGIVRGRLDTDDQYTAKLRDWIGRLKVAGSQQALGQEIFDYLGNCHVRVVNRAGHWYCWELDGLIHQFDVPWDWDSISNPERHDPAAPYWSDLWVVIAPEYPLRPLTMGDLSGADDGFGIGALIPRQQLDALKEIIDRFKAAHSCVRAVLMTTNILRYDPHTPVGFPNGKWGMWGIYSGGSYIASDRDLTETRYLEPR